MQYSMAPGSAGSHFRFLARRLTCKIVPRVLAEILKQSSGFPVPPQLLVGIDTRAISQHAALKSRELNVDTVVVRPDWLRVRRGSAVTCQSDFE